MPTAQDWLSQILFELSAAMPSGPAWDAETTQLMQAIQLQAPTVWAMYAGYATIFGRQQLYVKRRLLEIIVGQLRTKRNGTLGGVLRVEGEALFRHLDFIRRGIDQEIKDLEVRARANMAPCVGAIPHLPPPIRVPGAPQPTFTTTFAAVNGATVATSVINAPPCLDPASPLFTNEDPRVDPPKVQP